MRLIATIPVYNEADILRQVLDHLHEHGIAFVILDGGSQDGSIEIALSYKGRGLLEHRILRRDILRRREVLDHLLQMVVRYNPDWILRNYADEFLQPPEPRATLCEAIAKEDRRGFNVIQFDNFIFYMTEKDYDSTETDVRKKLRYYAWNDDYRYKAWKYYAGTTDRENGGHYPVFPKGVKARVSPRRFVLRHYRFRSPEQAKRRVFKERLPRFAREERFVRWHFHYDHFKDEPQFIIDSKLLSRYDEDSKWDLTKRIDWDPGRKYPTREELFERPGPLQLVKRLALSIYWSVTDRIQSVSCC